MNRKYSSKYTIVFLIVIILLFMPTNWVNAALPIIDPDTLRQDDLELSDLDLLQATSTFGPWTDVPGSLSGGFTMQLDPAVEYYYFDAANPVVNRPLADDLYPFYLDTINLTAGFYTYWEARDVTESASGGWEEIMWDIITGTAPMFYLKVAGTSYDLVDGLQYLVSSGTLEAPLRVNGDYPLGVYSFNGTVEDELGYTDDVVVAITFMPPFSLDALDLLGSTNQIDWKEVPGSLSGGFTMQIDPGVTYYYFDAANLVVNRSLADDLYPFCLDTASLPAAFYTYWEVRGVTESASGGWEEIMWDIINGIEPMFYLKVDGTSYDLIDGLQYLASGGTLEAPLRVNGDYPLGTYNFTGIVEDEFGCTDDIVVAITFVSPLALEALDLLESTNQVDWLDVSGELTTGFTMYIDSAFEYYYLDAENLVVNRPLANNLYPFYLDTASLPTDFYTYWEARGVTASASGGWEEIMWDIITGTEPMFYLKVNGINYDLVDGLQYLASSGTLEEPLRVNGEYPLGDYNFNGTVEDDFGYTDDVVVVITFVSPLELSALDLLASTNKIDWTEVCGNLIDGFTIQLNPSVEYYYFDAENLVVNRSLASDLYPFYLGTASLPTDFYTYWEARGVTASVSGGWEEIMWDIITGTAPMFYLKVEGGTSYDLVDGLQYLVSGGTLEELLRVNGDYPLGDYNFSGSVEDEFGYTDDIVVPITFVSLLELSALDLLESTNQVDWTEVDGDLTAGFTMQLDPSDEYYYFDTANLVVNRPLANDLYPFYLDTASLPADFYTYWEARGVTASASGGWEAIMWEIINGTSPMFYVKVDGASYDLVDGLQYLVSGGTLEEPLRVNGDYPLGDYSFNGIVEDEFGCTDAITVSITFISPLELSALDLLESTNQVDWTGAHGNFVDGFTMLLDPVVEYYYLDAANLVVNRPLANDLYPFFLDTTSLPAAFYTYWADRGVDAGATSGWQVIMWEIINGTEPMFYLKVDGITYDLVDGLQYLASGGTLEAPLRVNGDYPLGTYNFTGTVEDDLGFTDDVSVRITFNDVPVAHDQNVSTDEDTALGIILTASDQYPGTLIWDYTQPGHGSVSGTAPDVSYHPDENWSGSDTFTFSVDDENYGNDTAIITITVDPINDPPTAYAQSVNTLIESPVAITLEAEDVEDDPLFWYRGDPSQGSISGVAPNLIYTPTSGYTGPDSFIFWVEDAEFESERVEVSIIIYEELEVTEVNLQQSINQTVWISVDGTLADGYNMDLDTAVAYYYLDVTNLVVNRPLANNLTPFYLDTTSLPTAFYTYWADRGVTESASGGWEEIMWDIINGTAPMFYLKVDGTSYDLIDGLQFLVSGETLEEPLRINGDYWPGMYSFSGVVEDELGYIDELNIAFTLNDIPVTNSQSVATEVNLTLDIVLSAVDLFGDPLQYEISQDPSHGELSGTPPNLSYDPDTDFIGLDSFKFIVTDAHGAVSQAAVISIRVHEPACLVVNPTFLEQTLLQDATDTQTLSITNTCTGEVPFEIIEAGPPTSEMLLYEDFENYLMLPAGGWEVVHDGDTGNEWEIIENLENVFEGQQAAWIHFDDDNNLDEWLITPILDASTYNNLVLTFMALSDTNWTDDATVQVWVLNENNQKLSAKPLWDMGDENWENWGHHFVLVDLREFAGCDQLRIGWEYIGQAGQSFGLDVIKVGNRSEVPWASSAPETSTIIGGETQDVGVTFDSSGLALGDYFAYLFIEDSPYPEISIPLTLHVRGDDRFYYLPLIVR